MKTKITIKRLALPAVATLLCSGSAQAQNLLINGDFETGPALGWVADYADYSNRALSPVPGWTLNDIGGSDDAWIWHAKDPDDATSWVNADENAMFDTVGDAGGLYAGGIKLKSGIVPGYEASMSQLVTDITCDLSFTGVMAAPSRFDTGSTGTIGYTTFLGGVEVSSGSSSVDNKETATFDFNIAQASGAFDSVEVYYAIESVDGGSSLVSVDNLSLTCVVPEPSSALLLGLGSLSLLRRKRA
ncbi:MAG: PEP-CTERM sorting domain-containing protein [Roseibacillus sp.]